MSVAQEPAEKALGKSRLGDDVFATIDQAAVSRPLKQLSAQVPVLTAVDLIEHHQVAVSAQLQMAAGCVYILGAAETP